MASTPKARSASGRADGLFGDVKLVREGGVLIDEVLALGLGEGEITVEIVELVAHALHHAVVLVGGGMPRGAFGGARAPRVDGGGEGGVERPTRRRGGRRRQNGSRDVNILPAGASTREREVSSRRRGAMGGEGSKMVVLQRGLLEALGDVQGVEERRGSRGRSAGVRKGGSKSRVTRGGRLGRHVTSPALDRAEVGA